MLVVRVDVPEPDVPAIVFDSLLLPFHDVQHVREVGRDMAMCLRPDGLVVAEVDEAVSVAVERSID